MFTAYLIPPSAAAIITPNQRLIVLALLGQVVIQYTIRHTLLKKKDLLREQAYTTKKAALITDLHEEQDQASLARPLMQLVGNSVV